MEKELTTQAIDYNIDALEDEEMASKFYDYNCINLYAYIDNNIAHKLTSSNTTYGVLNTPLDLYESPYTAKIMASNISNKQLMTFAIDVNNIFDELDLELDQKIAKTRKKEEEIRKNMAVIRSIKKYTSEGKKSRFYVVYTIQNQNVIRNTFPF